MQDWTDFDGYEEDDEQQANGPKALREALKTKDKELNKLREQVAEITKRDRTRTVADVLSTKGLPGKVAELIPETVEATESAVEQWLGQYSDIFGIKQADAGNETDTAGTENVVPPEQTALNRMAQTANSGQAPANKFVEQINEVATMPYEDLLKKIAEAQRN